MTTQLFKNTLHGIAELSPGYNFGISQTKLYYMFCFYLTYSRLLCRHKIYLCNVYNLAVWMMLVVTACGNGCVSVTHTNLRAGKSVVEDFTEERWHNTTALFQYKLKGTKVPPYTQYQKHIFSYFKLSRLSFNIQRKCFLLKKQNKMTWLLLTKEAKLETFSLLNVKRD